MSNRLVLSLMILTLLVAFQVSCRGVRYVPIGEHPFEGFASMALELVKAHGFLAENMYLTGPEEEGK